MRQRKPRWSESRNQLREDRKDWMEILDKVVPFLHGATKDIERALGRKYNVSSVPDGWGSSVMFGLERESGMTVVPAGRNVAMKSVSFQFAGRIVPNEAYPPSFSVAMFAPFGLRAWANSDLAKDMSRAVEKALKRLWSRHGKFESKGVSGSAMAVWSVDLPNDEAIDGFLKDYPKVGKAIASELGKVLKNYLGESTLSEDEDGEEFFIDLELGDRITVDLDGEEVEGEIDRFTDNGFVLLSYALADTLDTYEIIDIEGVPFVVARVNDGWVELAVTDEPDAGYWIAGEPWEYEQDAPMDEALNEATRRYRVRYSKTKSGGFKRKRTQRSKPGERRRAKKYYRRHKAKIKRRRKIRKRKPAFKQSQKRLRRARGK